MGSNVEDSKVLVYLMRRDLRVADNPILHHLATKKDHGFTHLLPLYVFAAKQIEVSGFLEDGKQSPYPEAKSEVANFWRCGPHRAKFLAESVWNLKEGLEQVGSGLKIRVGNPGEVIENLVNVLKQENPQNLQIHAVWMTAEESSEEKTEENDVKQVCEAGGVAFKLWEDEKYFLDDRDVKKVCAIPEDLPDVFTGYRKKMEPLRDAPRPVLSSPRQGALPPFPAQGIPSQHSPFAIPDNYNTFFELLMKPLTAGPLIVQAPPFPEGAKSVHPFMGGETTAHARLDHLLESGALTSYKETRNGMLGTDFSSKLSAWLAIGCVTGRQIHSSMLAFENGNNPAWEAAPGYGKGENDGTNAMRFELLWRDYMRLCTGKYGVKLFQLAGFKQRQDAATKWARPGQPIEGQSNEEVQDKLDRFLNGTTGMGLIDASQREIFHTGYTSNRARQNVASFFAKHLYMDWRIGAEWYESLLVDYDVSSNWGNWQYVAGVGNDPRDDLRVFNPVKQSYDYDPQGEYVKTWVQELRELEEPAEIFQCWTVPEEERAAKGLAGLKICESPLKQIDFTVGRRAPSTRGKGRGRGRGRGGNGGGGYSGGNGGGNGGYGGGGTGGGQNNNQQRQPQARGGYGGRGFGNSRGHLNSRGGHIVNGYGYPVYPPPQSQGYPGQQQIPYHILGAGYNGYLQGQGVAYQGMPSAARGGRGFFHQGGGVIS